MCPYAWNSSLLRVTTYPGFEYQKYSVSSPLDGTFTFWVAGSISSGSQTANRPQCCFAGPVEVVAFGTSSQIRMEFLCSLHNGLFCVYVHALGTAYYKLKQAVGVVILDWPIFLGFFVFLPMVS